MLTIRDPVLAIIAPCLQSSILPGSSGVSPARSFLPRPIVLTAIPVARETAAIPP